MEYTGIYNDKVVEFLSSKHYALWVENALAIQKSLGCQRGKSDTLDAKRMAQYAYRFQDKAQPWIPERQVIRQIKALVCLRQELIKSKDTIAKPLKEYKKLMPEI